MGFGDGGHVEKILVERIRETGLGLWESTSFSVTRDRVFRGLIEVCANLPARRSELKSRV